MSDKASYIVRRDLRKERLWKGGGPQLLHLDIELPGRCNNNCIHCYINHPLTMTFDKKIVVFEISLKT